MPQNTNFILYEHFQLFVGCVTLFSGMKFRTQKCCPCKINYKYGQKIKISREQFVLPDLTSTHFSFATKLCTTKLIDER